jgi:hypothetical protein
MSVDWIWQAIKDGVLKAEYRVAPGKTRGIWLVARQDLERFRSETVQDPLSAKAARIS